MTGDKSSFKRVSNTLEAWHQRNRMNQDLPLQIFMTDIAEFPPHWHEEIEIIYALQDNLAIGLNNEIFSLQPRDILIIGQVEVHFFPTSPKTSLRLIIQFELSCFESLVTVMRNHRILTPFLPAQANHSIHRDLERQLLDIKEEHQNKKEAYQLAIKARLYDLMVFILRRISLEPYSPQERNKYQKRLESLENVFKYVESNFTRSIKLAEAAQAANFSIFYFTRFFKDTTGMTFIEYLNNYRISKAIHYLETTTDPITEIAFQSGFESIKTFNRIFKQLKGCSPSNYKKSIRI
jgi:AraC-like DNA-binding protein